MYLCISGLIQGYNRDGDLSSVFFCDQRLALHQSRPQATSGSGSATRRGPAAQAGPSRWTLVALRRARNPLLIPGVRPGNQSKHTKKERPSEGTVFPENCASADALFYYFLVDFRFAKIKRGFRTLRSPAQGSALRTRSLSRKAGESFHYGCGGYSPMTWNTTSRTRFLVSHSRSPAQGSALRTRSLSRKAGESFHYGCGGYSPMTWNTTSRTRFLVSHSTNVRFCHGPIVNFPSTNGITINGESKAALICDEPLSSCQVSW